MIVGPISGPDGSSTGMSLLLYGYHVQSKYASSLTNVACRIKKIKGITSKKIIATTSGRSKCVIKYEVSACWIQVP